ncbi:ATP-dependent DNA ligase LigD phosphoesterase module /ATP-dependent DNA ligase LigD polymerase module [Pedobacter westerhofensis]|uniref:DNA ligase (ATP) n=1 Tax=Pedobacter westerhofensis TaxID=425512 RepID=A0A521BBM3_9SPHI|nr:DNA ligase D [Pedobacter westerhofensis]SMO44483.1 ATP-dependent DNA ligase LigD phosphoesterase module /ATP-dependent DNA ligase LigD polymerase module [Pedobacter westerhofensis]
MKIASYNINGINGRLDNLLRWLAQAKPDVVCLQELKSPDSLFPEDELLQAGYHAIWQGQKSWNGVAILSRYGPIQLTTKGLKGDDEDVQSRYIEAYINDIVIGCLYLPNGNPWPGEKFSYKLNWMKRLIKHAQQLQSFGLPVALIGDYNIMPTDLDTYKPEKYKDNALFRPEARKLFLDLLDEGYTDAIRKLFPDAPVYTFWDYLRKAYDRDAGLRLDHFLLNQSAAEKLMDGGVDKDVRGWAHSSDHAPVWINLNDHDVIKKSKGSKKETVIPPTLDEDNRNLKEYNKKRDFSRTAEPKSGNATDSGMLRFVIQKHDATRLHYDFRLEMDGVLKSWAVPKGPSTDPKTKRLAMMVEDHPFDYRTFEGIIPKGQYGGGTVIVWDEGTYEPIANIKGKKAQEKHLLEQLNAGSVKIIMHGQKLQGEFALVKTHGMGENGWLLIKHNDEYASADDITVKGNSVLTNKTIEEMGTGNQPAEQSKSIHHAGDNTPKLSMAEVQSLLNHASDAKIPIGMKPMLATLVDEPFNDPDWVYEIKWDGYRALGFSLSNGDVQLLSRNNKQFNEKFYPVYELLQSWKLDIVVDGEIMVINDKGAANFGDLQNWNSEKDGELVYYVFDIIWYDGKDLTDLPLIDRQAILQAVLPQEDERIRLSQVYRSDGIEFFNAAAQMGLEGIIAKKADSLYSKNNRSAEWLKVKASRRQEVVIAGFTRNEDTSKLFSSLLLGVFEEGVLYYVGKVGTGFNDKDQREMMKQFKTLIIDHSPFSEIPDVNKPSRFRPNPPKAKATWLRPELVCEVAFAEVTSDGVFRHPSFKGMRTDKSADEVTREAVLPVGDILKAEALEDEDEAVNDKPSKASKKAGSKIHKLKNKKILLSSKADTQLCSVNGHELKFTHLSKLYWPEDKVSKRDMFNFYDQIADFILPYLKDRPMSLNRFPGGIHSQSFYQKDVKDKAPSWADTFPYTNSEGDRKEYLLGNDEAALLWMASLGCIEMNPWFSRSQSPDNPDYCVIDLDPDKNTFDQVIQVAQMVKEILDQIGVPCYPKTSGSTGIHIYIPLQAQYTYEQSQMFARIIVNLIHEQVPDFTSLERMISARKGKMYLDFMQNRAGATIAGPYSLRPKPGATVSMPLSWDELKPGLTMRDFTIFNAVDRLKETGDLFRGVLGTGIDLGVAVRKAKEVFG